MIEEHNIPHPEEEGRTFLGDLEGELAQFDERVEGQGLEQWHESEISNLYAKVRAEYEEPRRRTEESIAAWTEDARVAAEEVEAELEEREKEVRKLLEDDEMEPGSRRRGGKEAAGVDDDAEPEELGEEEGAAASDTVGQELEERFEEESMYNPGFGGDDEPEDAEEFDDEAKAIL